MNFKEVIGPSNLFIHRLKQ